MALGDGTLNLISDMIDSAYGNLRKYNSQIDECIARLNNNSNYQEFVSNTEIGSTLNENLLKLRNIGNDTSDDVNRLLNTTNEFVETQRALNQSTSTESSSYYEESYDDTDYSSSSSETSSSTSTTSSTYASKANWYQNYYSGRGGH